MSIRRLPIYLTGQFLGAFIAAVVLYILFSGSIAEFEAMHGIVRGSPESVKTAMMFGEFYPNPSAAPSASVTTMNAFLAEAFGTFTLVFLIFALTEGCNVGRPDNSLTPFFVGLSVAIIICIIAPLTQAGINPARDLSPRIFSYLAGWKKAAFPDQEYGFLTVYVFGPLIGGVLASIIFTIIIEPLMNKKSKESNSKCQ